MAISLKYKSRGFTLLFAALVGSLVIAVGMAILNITIKQLTLASAGRESQQAFFAADAGVECALYLDRGASVTDCQLGLFGAPSTNASGMSICGQDLDPGSYNNSDTMQCFGKQISVTRTLATGGQSVTNTFSLRANNPSAQELGGGDNEDMCFEVAVKKTLDNNNEATTIIESRGYNTCNENAFNRFERAIRSVNK